MAEKKQRKNLFGIKNKPAERKQNRNLERDLDELRSQSEKDNAGTEEEIEYAVAHTADGTGEEDLYTIEEVMEEARGYAIDKTVAAPDSFDLKEKSVKADAFVLNETEVNPDAFVLNETEVNPDAFVLNETELKPDAFVLKKTGEEQDTSAVNETGDEPDASAHNETGDEPDASAHIETGNEPDVSAVNETDEEPEASAAEDKRKGKRNRDKVKKDKVKKDKVKKDKGEELTPILREKRRARTIALAVLALVVVIVFALCSYVGYRISESELNLPNVYAGEVFIGGMTQEETLDALEASEWDKAVKTDLNVTLPAGVSFALSRAESGAILTEEQILEVSRSFGHDGNIYENLYTYITNFFTPVDVVEKYRVMDDKYIRDTVEKGVEDFYTATAEEGYVIEEKESLMRMVKGGGELKFDLDAMCKALSENLCSDAETMEYDSFVSLPESPDFAAIHKELEREPKDAYYTETFEVVPNVVGCKFDIDQAAKIWNDAKYGDTIEIPMDITFPAVTSEELESRLFRDILGEQTTYYPLSSDNRINNLNMAVKKISGTILLPGETFSYNEAVGQRTEEAGFLPAGAYDDGEVVEQIGGGVCQVSSTLYSATIFAQMETVDRTCHFFAVDYLDRGMDATVSWPSPDFKFKNCRDYPIKIIAYCDNEARSITASIMGTDTDGSYVKVRQDVYTIFGEYGEAIGRSIHQFRDIYDADGNFLRTEEYNYNDEYYFHDYKKITEQAKAAAEAAAAGSGGSEGAGNPDYSGAPA